MMPNPGKSTTELARSVVHERRRQVRGLLFLAVLVLLFSIWRVGFHRVFPPGWWRLW